MNLDDTQRQKVAAWINEGQKLSEIQIRLEKELGLRMTYLDVRLLVDELKLMPKDPLPPPAENKPAPKAEAPAAAEPEPEPELEPEPQIGGSVKVTVDQIAHPGAVVSGKVTFSDAKTVTWFLDETTGRLGIGGADKSYRPPQADIQEFQLIIQRELQKLGY